MEPWNKKARMDEVTSYSFSSFQGPAGSSSSTPSPTSGTSAQGPFRGRYTRSSLGNTSLNSSMGGTRFSPYSVSGRERPASRLRSMNIIARRDEEQGQGLGNKRTPFGNMSSTAMKICETLANHSAPVLKTGRVRIDAIKKVKPLGGSSLLLSPSGTFLSPSNKFLTGPPKTGSPLLVPLTSSSTSPLGKQWALRGLSYPPKMVDCGTNTEELKETTVINEEKKETIPVKTTTSSTITAPDKPENLASLLARSSTFKKHLNGEYTFNKAWTLNEIHSIREYLGKHDKREEQGKTLKIEKGDFEKNFPKKEEPIKIVNGDDFVKQKFLNHIKAQADKWECPSCMQLNEAHIELCVCCETLKPGGKGSKGSFGISSAPSVSTSPAPTFTFGTGNKGMGSPAPASSNFSFGGGNTAAKPKASLISPNKRVLNGEEFEKELLPKKRASLTPKAEKWECPTCMIFNESNMDSCPCCSTQKPGTGSVPLPATTSAPSFTFGVKSSVPSAVVTTSASFTFGFGSTSTTATTFSTTTTTFPAPLSSFKFGSSNSGSIPNGDEFDGEKGRAKQASLGFQGGTAKTSEKWDCPDCMVQNDGDITTCPCCGARKPGGSSATASSEPAAPTPAPFKFGFGGSPAVNPSSAPISTNPPAPTTAPSGFTFKPSPGAFGAPATSPASLSSFKFGTGKSDSESIPNGEENGSAKKANLELQGGTGGTSSIAPSGPTAAAPAPFTFGVTSNTAITTTSAPTSTTSTASLSGFTFKASAGAFGTAAPAPASAQPFSFGSSTATPFGSSQIGTTPAPTFGSSNPSATVALNVPKSTINFGATAGNTKPPAAGAGATTGGFNFNTAASPGYNFGSTAAPPASSQQTNIFQSSTTGAPGGTSTATPFGTSPAPTFGSNAAATPQFNLPSTFNFGATAGNANPPAPAGTGATTGGFNFNTAAPPAFNFGATAQPPAGSPQAANLFQFSATSTAGGTDMGQRKIKKATRRHLRN